MLDEIHEVAESEYEHSYKESPLINLTKNEVFPQNLYSRLTNYNDTLFQAAQLLYLLDRLKRKRFNKISKEKVTYLAELCQIEINNILDVILSKVDSSSDIYVYDNPSNDLLFVFLNKFDIYIKECSRTDGWFNLRKLKWRATVSGYDIMYPSNSVAITYNASTHTYVFMSASLLMRLEDLFTRKRFPSYPFYIYCETHTTPAVAIVKRNQKHK